MINQQQQQQCLHLQPHLSKHLKQPARQQLPVKTTQPSGPQDGQVQRKLLAFFYVYGALVLSVWATYAVYHLYQFQVRRQPLASPQQDDAESLRLTRAEPEPSSPQELEARVRQLELKLEKLHLLERYMDVMANELQDTRNRQREREKCDCSVSCTFNNTRYQDRSSWQNQCDICTCRLGQISCAPQKCPPVACDDPVQLAGQCCPTCMKQCKHNNTLIKHGQRFRPAPDSASQPQKECKCHDGRIKCELSQRSFPEAKRQKAAANATQSQVTPQLQRLGSASGRTKKPPTQMGAQPERIA